MDFEELGLRLQTVLDHHISTSDHVPNTVHYSDGAGIQINPSPHCPQEIEGVKDCFERGGDRAVPISSHRVDFYPSFEGANSTPNSVVSTENGELESVVVDNSFTDNGSQSFSETTEIRRINTLFPNREDIDIPIRSGFELKLLSLLQRGDAISETLEWTSYRRVPVLWPYTVDLLFVFLENVGRSGVWAYRALRQIGRAVQQECRDRSRMPSSA
eukprot:TRINITY_DN8519_c0_g1_i1.p1 TRINITY_DN8519_c0_g1~~TRINITY_DN8519_c0_g1_i1.p1  ORF type:complete len:215 (-),score=9.06 TRINITY_DN8519_c0_g1_i1:23-667(-)